MSSNCKQDFSSAILEQCGTCIVITDLDGRIRYANRAFQQLTGYSPLEVIGDKISLLKSGLTGNETYNSLWSTIRTGKAWRGELCNRKKSGELYWEAITITPICNESGVVEDFVATIEDITIRKSLEQERERLLGELRQAERKIEGLHGLLPICSHCKSIRCSNGRWQSLEGYLNTHSNAHLSHGVCPECLAQHYPAAARILKAV